MSDFGMIKPDPGAKGKNLESLKKSRQIRSDFIRQFGCMPTSILKHDRSASDAIDLSRDDGRRYTDAYYDPNKVKNKKLWDKTFKYSGVSVRKRIKKSWDVGCKNKQLEGGGKAALSTFPQKIGRLLVNFYCPKDGVVYDPFAGHNSRMQLVYESDRHYIGVDISKQFMKDNRIIRNMLYRRNKYSLIRKDKTIQLIEGSSDKVDLPDNYADFTITSPPYWDLEYYGDEKEQLGRAKTYRDFINRISLHIKENFRILKSESFCCWCINDFSKNKVFYPYHIDLFVEFVKNGFMPFSIYILDLGHALGSVFVQSIIKTRRFPKRHEYCLIFIKP